MKTGDVLFIDSECLLCRGIASYLFIFDRQNRLKFAPLLGETAAEAMGKGLFDSALDSVVYIRGYDSSTEEIFTKSDVIVALGKDLGGRLHVLRLIQVIPRVLRDTLYDVVATHRYQWFGRSQSCELLDSAQDKMLP